MFTRILVPLDGSILAERALPVAARLAHASGGSVILLQVLGMTTTISPATPPELVDHNAAEKYLSSLSTSPVLRGIHTEKMAPVGDAAATILSVATSSRADAIVISSHGTTNATQWAIGSIAEKVARHSSIPVLILRKDGPIPARPHLDITRPLRVLVPLDGSEYAQTALKPAIALITALADPAPAALHLVLAMKPLAAHRQEEQNTAMQQAKQYLNNVEDQLRQEMIARTQHSDQPDLSIGWSITLAMDSAAAILEAAESGENITGASLPGKCDVIAMSTHGRNGLQLWTMGSTTERVLHATRLPILVIHPAETAVPVKATTQPLHAHQPANSD